MRDPRLVVERQARAGLAVALNRALARARAPLVARLDADDVALPARLERQRAFLQAHPEVGLLGTAARVVDESGRDVDDHPPPEDDRAIRRALIRRNPFVHSSVMLRRALVSAVGGYDVSFAVAQDYDLWLRLSAVTRMANLAEPLVIRHLRRGPGDRRARRRAPPRRGPGALARGARGRLPAVGRACSRCARCWPWPCRVPLRGPLRRALGR